MCGIFAGISTTAVVPTILTGLERLEYRGYDSAGIATINHQGVLGVTKVVGKVAALKPGDVSPNIAIAHTRWATHGLVSQANAHPHCSGERISVVHNGIIDNAEQLAEQVGRERLRSQTDSEVIAHLLADQQAPLEQAMRHVCQQLQGSYAIAAIDVSCQDRLLVSANGSPLVIGRSANSHWVASDLAAFAGVAEDYLVLASGDIAMVYADRVRLFDGHGQVKLCQWQPLQLTEQVFSKQGHRHYMLSEIHQQPQALQATLAQPIGRAFAAIKSVAQVTIAACGTSYHAGLVAKYWLAHYCQLPCEVVVASEFDAPVVAPNSLLLLISQSGETADTLACLAYQARFDAVLAICNVGHSTLARQADSCILTASGQEIGVASTKAFACQLAVLWQLCRHRHGTLPKANPQLINEVLTLAKPIAQLAKVLAQAQHCLFIARGELLPIAQEGALKLTEISYIHGQAFAGGELKHGPLALIEDGLPVIACARNDRHWPKLKANIAEVQARGAKVILFAEPGCETQVAHRVALPVGDPAMAPIIHGVALQLLAYYSAVHLGREVDQPRNLAKSVTVG